MKKWLFAPSGLPITRISSYSFNSPEIEVDDDGSTSLGWSGDYPTFEAMDVPGYGEMGLDTDCDEWLLSHCRLIEVDDDFDVWDEDFSDELAWDEEIVEKCGRMHHLTQNLWLTQQLREWLPTDVSQDPTIDAVLTNIIDGRLRGEADRLQLEIDAYRATRTEPTTLVEPEPVDEVEGALTLMRGGVS